MNLGGPGTAGFADRTEGSVSDSSSARSAKYADIAQMVEQRPFKAWGGGSIVSGYDCHRCPERSEEMPLGCNHWYYSFAARSTTLCPHQIMVDVAKR